jgi:replicative superfamily II helicase
MNFEKAIELYARIERDPYSQNLFARANARYILFGVNEDRINFPPTLESNLDNGSDALAFSYLSIGCRMAEEDIFDERTKNALEKGAEFIEYTHLPTTNRSPSSKYYLLVGALAYYASFQYSKAFILIKEAESYETDVAVLTSNFLKKNFDAVNSILNKILLQQKEYLSIGQDNFLEKVYHPHVVIFAKALANLMDYLYTGNQSSLEKTNSILRDLLELLLIDQEPSLWWISRLFKVIANGFNRSSLWANIVPLLPNTEKRVIDTFISNLIFSKKTIVELFAAQQSALPLIAANKGAVISLPTSSGKTQIAILAILKCLTEKPDVKVLYIAPYRSLAFEVENALKEAFDILDFEVSQLYGSGQFGKLDKMLIEDASILIATPEKAKVILRANEEITDQIKLVIIDEGHLLDEKQRNVKNELFVEELKVHIRNNKGIILLLSAVLPNTKDVANWITADETLSVAETERLARQRLGILDYRSNAVSLEWMGDEKSFNRNFIRPIHPKGKKKLIQPKNKAISIGMTALRLSEQGKSVLVFTSRATSVNTYAKAILESMEILYGGKEIHNWEDEHAWQELNLLCSEYDFNKTQELLNFAKYGILCHYGSLNKDVRNVLERLMKSGNPRIIVATMTLGQGVNIGISTVILADTDFYDREQKKWIPISNNEVWNVIGRAGRAFQDIEGKILFASESKDQRLVALNYINNPPKDVISGLLLKIKYVKNIAKQCKVDFPLLLELIANNDFSRFSTFYFKRTKRNVDAEFYEVFDWIDDTILSLGMLSEEHEQSLDDIIRSTLAYIQASDQHGVSSNDVLKFLNARNSAIESMIPLNSSRRLLAMSSLPLASAVALDQAFDDVLEYGAEFLASKQTLDNKLALLKKVEEKIKGFPSYSFKPKKNEVGKLEFSTELIDEARELWISGKNLSSGSDVGKIIKLGNQYFGYTLSWVIGAIGNKCRSVEQEELATVFEELALSCELGLPNAFAAKIYLSGIKSRIATLDICNSPTFVWDARENMSLREIKEFVLNSIDPLLKEVKNDLTKEWLHFTQANYSKSVIKTLPKINNFTLPKHKDLKTSRLYVKSIDQTVFYLSSPDYTESFKIENSKKWPFELYANKMNYYFDFVDGVWSLVKQT